MKARFLGVGAVLAFAASVSAQSIAYRATGSNGQHLGLSADRVPDANGDGVSELALAGRDSVRLVSGVDGSTLFEVAVGTPGAAARIRVAGLADVDADGAGDFALGVVEGGPGASSGRIEVRSGATGGVLYSLPAAHPLARLGYEVAGLGDVDGDGAGDFAATSKDPLGSAQVAVFSGATGVQLSLPYVGGDEGDNFLARSAGDIDGDGVEDLLVAALSHGGLAFSGSTGAFLRDFPMVPGPKFAQGIGDFDGDGRSDVVMISLQAPNPGLLYSGRTGDLLQFLPDGLLSASRIGDMNGDGLADIGLGYVGTPSRFAVLFSGPGPMNYAFDFFVARNTLQSRSLVGMGDVNGDGHNEVAVVDPGYIDLGGSPLQLAGRAWIYDNVSPAWIGSADVFGVAGPCPCGNTNFYPNGGCENSTGSGAFLGARGSTSVSSDDLSFVADRLPPTTTVLLGVGDFHAPSLLPTGDGLRALAGQVRRLRVMSASIDGRSASGVDLAAFGGWSAGDTRQFQVFYRDPSGPCGSGFNFTNPIEVLFTP